MLDKFEISNSPFQHTSSKNIPDTRGIVGNSFYGSYWQGVCVGYGQSCDIICPIAPSS